MYLVRDGSGTRNVQHFTFAALRWHWHWVILHVCVWRGCVVLWTFLVNVDMLPQCLLAPPAFSTGLFFILFQWNIFQWRLYTYIPGLPCWQLKPWNLLLNTLAEYSITETSRQCTIKRGKKRLHCSWMWVKISRLHHSSFNHPLLPCWPHTYTCSHLHTGYKQTKDTLILSTKNYIIALLSGVAYTAYLKIFHLFRCWRQSWC